MDVSVRDEITTPHARLLDGRRHARLVRREVEEQISHFVGRHGFTPRLAVLLVGDEPDSRLYAQNLVRWFTTLGLGCSLIALEAETVRDRVLSEVLRISEDPLTHGLLVQMPLPGHITPHEVFSVLSPLKDVEGLHPENAGLLASGTPRFVPSTPLAGVELLRAYEVDVAGKHAVILGRSNVVGKPLAQLFLQQDASVTVLHSRSRQTLELVRSADLVAAAVGKPNLITAEMLKPGAIVLDFGINFVGDNLVGDVTFDEVVSVASMISPVPGGIGPLTNLMLARNLLLAAALQLEGAAGVDAEDEYLEDPNELDS